MQNVKNSFILSSVSLQDEVGKTKIRTKELHVITYSPKYFQARHLPSMGYKGTNADDMLQGFPQFTLLELSTYHSSPSLHLASPSLNTSLLKAQH